MRYIRTLAQELNDLKYYIGEREPEEGQWQHIIFAKVEELMQTNVQIVKNMSAIILM